MGYLVYKHTTPSGKIYIGITSKEASERWRNGSGYKNKHFENAIKKYGWNNIKHEILFKELTREEACLMEKLYIGLYNTTDRKYGYNLTYGGESGVLFTEEVKQKISNSLKGENHPMYGKEFSEERKQRISEAKLGHTTSKEARAKMSKSHTGKKVSFETKKRMSKSHIGKSCSEDVKLKIRTSQPSSKKVLCTNTGEIFISVSEASRTYNICTTNISKCCKGQRKTAGTHPITGEKLNWEYVEG